jgi:hypothetical protein
VTLKEERGVMLKLKERKGGFMSERRRQLSITAVFEWVRLREQERREKSRS